MVDRIYPADVQTIKACSSDTEAPFVVSYSSISNSKISPKLDDKLDGLGSFPFP